MLYANIGCAWRRQRETEDDSATFVAKLTRPTPSFTTMRYQIGPTLRKLSDKAHQPSVGIRYRNALTNQTEFLLPTPVAIQELTRFDKSDARDAYSGVALYTFAEEYGRQGGSR